MGTIQEDSVQTFLAALDSDKRESFLNYVEHTYSVYEIWLYAGVLGYSGSFTTLERWIKANYPKLNRRQLLLTEVTKLEGDIAFLREQVQLDLIKSDAAATKIAHLSKELRGHLTEIERMTRATDRRGLILAGADAVMRSLRGIFRGNDEVVPVLEAAFDSVWAQLENEK